MQAVGAGPSFRYEEGQEPDMNDAQRSAAAFEQASTCLESSVRDACDQALEWPARVAAAIYAVLDFASTDETASRSLVFGRPSSGDDAAGAYAQLIDRFAELLAAEAPRRRSVSTGKPVLRSVAAMIAEPVRSGRPERLSEIGPELVQLVLQPYLSFAEAKSWADRTSPSRSGASLAAVK
jgi:hypothetical protein